MTPRANWILPQSFNRIATRRHKAVSSIIEKAPRIAENTAHAINRQFPDLKS